MRLPLARFNKDNCKDILTAMSLAPVKQGRDGQITKDKSSEKRLTVLGQEATHFNDTLDLRFLSIDKRIFHIQPDFLRLYFDVCLNQPTPQRNLQTYQLRLYHFHSYIAEDAPSNCQNSTVSRQSEHLDFGILKYRLGHKEPID